MYLPKTILQIAQTKLRQIPVFEILARGRKWLARHKWGLGFGLLGLLALQLVVSRRQWVTLEGEALGTHYKVQYFDRWGKSYQREMEVLLGQIEQALSLAWPDSELAQFNAHDCTEFYLKSPFFYPVFAKSKEVYRNTEEAFDPTILPLVNVEKKRAAEAADLESPLDNVLQEYVSLDYVVANEQRIKRLKEGVKLDFGGLLKGYAVDQLADLLHTKGIDQAWIALGNELVVRGKPGKRQYWPTPIHSYVPVLASAGYQVTAEFIDKGVAISSKQPEGRVDPTLGSSTHHTLLAAVVVAPDCMSADAYATAMIVRGLAYAQKLVAKQKELDAFLIYEDEEGALAFYASPGLVMHQKKNRIRLRVTDDAS